MQCQVSIANSSLIWNRCGLWLAHTTAGCCYPWKTATQHFTASQYDLTKSNYIRLGYVAFRFFETLTGLPYKNHHRTEVQEVKPTAKCSFINMNADVPCQHSEWWRNRLCPSAAVVSGTWYECLALAPVCPQRFYQWLLETSTPHPTELTHREDLPGNGTIRPIKTTSRKANRKH